MSQVTTVRPLCEEAVRIPVSVGRRGLGVLAAALMVACSAVHVVGAATAAGHSGVHVLVMLAMAMVCLPCAVHVVLVPGRRMWLEAAALAGGMLAVHGVLALTPGAMTGHAGMAAPAIVSVGTVVGPALTLAVSACGVRASSRRPPASR